MKPIKKLSKKLILKFQQSNRRAPNLAFLLLWILIANAACVSTSVNYQNVSSAQWGARALLRDKAKKKTQVVYVNVLASRPNKIRMDFSTSMGIQLGALTVNESQFSLLMVQQKQFTTGKPVASVITRVLPVPVSPRLVLESLFEVTPTGTEWSCTKDKHDVLKECLNSQSGATISWTNRQGTRRTLSFTEKQFEVQFDLTGFQPNVQVQDGQFELQPPEGYQVRKL